MRMSRFYKNKKFYHHNNDGEMIVCILLMIFIFLLTSFNNMIFIKPHVFFKINFTGIDRSHYNISSFSCRDLEKNIHVGTNITFPSNEKSIHNLIFWKGESPKLPEYASLVRLDLSSNNCLWSDEIFLKIKDKRENTDVSFYIPDPGIYIIKEYYQPQMYSQKYKQHT